MDMAGVAGDTRTRIFVSAGEPSGDLHASNLIGALMRQRPGVEVKALGGQRMKAAGADLLHDMLGEFAVMGVTDALRVAPALRRLRGEVLDVLASWKPAAAVLVDYPGFHLNLAAHLKDMGIPVFYYICPQVWAWAPWRIRRIARRVDRVLVVFPFEEDIYRRCGVPVEYVGHPLGDFFASNPLDEDFVRNGPLSDSKLVISLLPGSRTNVVKRGFPVKAAAAGIIKRSIPDATFAVPVTSAQHAGIVRAIADEQGLDCHVFVGKTHEVMSMSGFALATSGTATLELAHFGVAMVVLYRTNALGIVLKRLLVTARHISLVNIVAGRQVVPELVYSRNRAADIARLALEILTDPGHMEAMRREVRQVGSAIDAPGASRKAAASILACL